MWNALDQARANAPSGADPVVVIKKNHEKPHVLISWDLFKRLIAAAPSQTATPRQQMLTVAAELQRMAAALAPDADETSMDE